MKSIDIRGLLTCGLVAGALALSGAVQAAEAGAPLKNQVYIVPGITLMGEDDDSNVNSYVAPGIGLGAQITDRWAIELHYASGETEQDGAANADIDAQSYRVDALYDFGTGGKSDWRLYGVGGIGSIDYDISGARSDEETLVNLGFGAMRSITERLAIRGDARGVLIDGDEIVPAATIAARYVFSGPLGPNPGDGDEDGDGVRDSMDRCLGTAPGVDVDASGCPRDDDRDGVPNASDACPRTPAGVSVDARGCALDSDRDGVADHLDACPDTPRGDEVDARGCTIEEEVAEIVSIELNLEFDYDSDKLRPEHYAEIERVAEFMNEHPGTSAQLEGHTDSRGTEAYNQALSERRAYSVRDYLIDESEIDPRRITAVGYGEARPAGTNDTDAGRQRNRRVEAVIEAREMSVRPRRED